MYFLAIVSQDDLLRGNIEPSYILYKSKGGSENRSSFRVYRANIEVTVPKILVTSPVGNDELIDFLSSYRTRDHMHGSKKYKYENTKKYYPHGALFWFECDDYGVRTGPAVFIKNVPDDKNKKPADSGFCNLKKAIKKTYSTKELFARTLWTVPDEYSNVRLIFYPLPSEDTNKN